MNILWLTAELPYPPNTGGKIVIFKRIEYISRNHKIFLFSFINNKDEVKYKKILEKYCYNVKIYNRKINLKVLIKSLFSPYMVESRTSAELKRDILQCIVENNIDIVNIEFPQVSKNIDNIHNINIPIVLNQHNIEYKALLSISKVTPNIVRKILFFYESLKMKAFEKNLYKRNIIDRYTFVSLEDKEFFQRNFISNEKKLMLTPIGTEISTKEIKEKHNLTKNIIFVGKMNYYPNVDAVKWFVTKIWPIITNNIPDVKFYIVGKDPTEEVQKLQNEKIIVTGTVDSIQPYLDMSDIYIIPLKSGGGVKVKLIEALGNNQLVITTSKGIEGTMIKPNEHVLLADEAQEFANKCIDALNNQNKYIDIIRNAKQLVIKEYSWQKVCSDYDTFLKQVVSEKKLI